LKRTKRIFEKGGRLKVMTQDEWKPEWVQILPVPEDEGGGA
jgi:hypothetical protein